MRRKSTGNKIAVIKGVVVKHTDGAARSAHRPEVRRVRNINPLKHPKHAKGGIAADHNGIRLVIQGIYSCKIGCHTCRITHTACITLGFLNGKHAAAHHSHLIDWSLLVYFVFDLENFKLGYGFLQFHIKKNLFTGSQREIAYFVRFITDIRNGNTMTAYCNIFEPKTPFGICGNTMCGFSII